MVAYIASQTLSHSDIAAEDEQGISVWDTLSPRSSGREARDTGTFWDMEDYQSQEVNADDDEDEEQIQPPARRRRRLNRLQEDEDYEEDEEEAFNTPESSAEHALFITQRDPEEFHEEGTLSTAQKGKTPVSKRDHLPLEMCGLVLG